MKKMRMGKGWLAVAAVQLLLVLLLGGCSSETDGEAAKKGKTISGIVTDLDQFPLEGVHVSAYGQSATSNGAGEFNFSAEGVPADRVVVNFQKEGFFDQTSGQKPSPNGSTNLKVAMLARELAGTVDNASGGQVSTGEMSGDFPPNAFVRGDGSELVGNVNIFAAYINPDNSNFGNSMPGGDFSAQSGGGGDGILTSYGALAIDAEEEASGEPALLRENANICLRIPFSMQADAPDTMPIWDLNNSGVWVELGTAQRFGDEYCFFMIKLGRINCDIFSNTAALSGTVCDGSGPVADTEVRIGQLATQTDDSGMYSILVQSSVELTLDTDYASATTGPLAPASSNTQDIGMCGGSTVSPSCQSLIDTAFPSTGSACGDACVQSYIDCLIANDCVTIQACIDTVTSCAAGC